MFGCPEIDGGIWLMLNGLLEILFTSVFQSDAKHGHVFGMLVLRSSGLVFSI
jgi:hypothetical protein